MTAAENHGPAGLKRGKSSHVFSQLAFRECGRFRIMTFLQAPAESPHYLSRFSVKSFQQPKGVRPGRK